MPEKVYCSECKWFREDWEIIEYGEAAAGCSYATEGNWYSKTGGHRLNPEINNANNDCKWWEGKDGNV